MAPTPRTPVLWLATIAVAAFGASSIAFYRPDGETNRGLALNSLQRALASLEDESLESETRLAAYGDGLSEAAALLHLALRSSPIDTVSIERLATVRWESGILAGSPDTAAVTSLMAIASSRAPRVPGIQADLGELLYRMGRADEATPFMARALALSTSMTNRVVATMTNAGLEPEEIVEALPRMPYVLIALKDSFLTARRGETFLDLVERDLPNATPSVLSTYGEACLQLRVPTRLMEHMVHLEAVDDRAIMAERARQAGHAAFAQGDITRALQLADTARRSMPGDPTYDEFFGAIALAAGRATDAASAFRNALAHTVRLGGPTRARARLYREIGQAVEAEGRGDLAVDDYRRAIALDPGEPYALARLAALDATVSGMSPE